MTESSLKITQAETAVIVVEQANTAKTAHTEYSRQQARKRLDYFEQKYHVTSEEFIKAWVAEDLEGKDMEYVEWAGEYHYFFNVEKDLKIM